MRPFVFFLREAVILVALATWAFGPPSASVSAAATRAGARPSAPAPLTFEENRGQAPEGVRFLSRGPGYHLFLSGDDALFTLRGSLGRARSLRMRFEGASVGAPMRGEDEQSSQAHYFVGRDPLRWTTNVPRYARVLEHGLYPGVDLAYRSTGDRLEYDLIVHPGADPSSIQVRVEGADGVAIDETGGLVLTLDELELVHLSPTLYQTTQQERGRTRVAGEFVLLAPDRVGFRVGSFDRSKPLVIDPEVLFSSFAGGSGRDELLDVAMDSSRNVYATGLTASLDYPVGGSAGSALAGDLDCVVSKWSASGSTLLYSAYIGGSGLDVCSSLAVDGSGRVFLVGTTGSADFPTRNALHPVFGGGDYDAVVVKLDPSGGSLEFSTYWGGTGQDFGFGLALSTNGAPSIVGGTNSLNFPTVNAFQAGYGGGALDAFVSRLTPSGSAVLYSTFLGGADDDQALDIAVDKNGSTVLTGVTLSADFPLLDPVQPAMGGESAFDAFVTKLGPSGALAFSTYLGGSETDIGFDVALDRYGRILVVGGTMSDDFPTTPGAFQTTIHGVMDGFVAAIDGTTLSFGTYLGGSSGEFVLGVQADPRGRPIVTGFTSSLDFPLARPTQALYGGGASDAFLAKLSRDGSSLVFSTYHGGSDQETAGALASDSNGRVFLAGGASSVDFPVSHGAFQASLRGDEDGFVARIATETLGEQFQDLGALVPELVNDSGGWRSQTLLTKLRGAWLALARGNLGAGVSLLVSFLREVQFLALTEGLPADNARLLIDIAAGMIGQIH
jgi:Beta-propeller repeat